MEKYPARFSKVSNTVAVYRPIVGGFPRSIRTKLRYISSSQVDESSGALGSWVFSANGLYDPDVTGIGHQPLGYDVFAQVYSRYLVLSSRIKVYVTCPSASANAAPSVIGVLLSQASSLTYTNADLLMEQGLSTYELMPMNGSVYRKIVLDGRLFSARTMFDCVDPSDLKDAIGAATNANPTLQAYHIVWFGQTPSGSDVVPLNLTVRLTYVVEFSTPLQLQSS